MSSLQITWLMVGKVFIIQFLVPITLILINLVISMNLFRYQQHENYQRGSLTAVRYGAILLNVCIGGMYEIYSCYSNYWNN